MLNSLKMVTEIDRPGRDPICGSCQLQRKELVNFPPVVFPCKKAQEERPKDLVFNQAITRYLCKSYRPTISYFLQSLKDRLIPFKNRLLRAAYSIGPSMPLF